MRQAMAWDDSEVHANKQAVDTVRQAMARADLEVHAREQAFDTVTQSTARDDSEVELLMMDAELINKIEKVEEKIEMLWAELTNELDILRRMMSNSRRTHSHGKYDELASETTRVYDNKNAQIWCEINDLKKGLNN